MRLPTRFHRIAVSVVILATFVAYHNTFSGPLIFDDASSITHNPSIRALWPLGAVLFPPSECTVAGRPFANLTFALNYAVGGTAVGGYHAVNLALHLGAALLLFGVVRRTLCHLGEETGSPDDAGAAVGGSATFVALAVAVIWAAHPVLTSSVTYISQRTEVLMATCYLATLYTFIRGVESASPRWLAISVGACFLGVASKEGMVTAPLLVFLYDRTFMARSFAAAWRKRWFFYLSLASSWLVLAYLMVGLKDRAVGYDLGVTWWTYALTESRAVLLYLRLIVWPFPLIFDYGVSFIDSISTAWPYLLGLGAILAATIMGLFRWPRPAFPVAAFFLLLAPTSSVVPVATQPIAENRLYLPAAAIVAFLVVGFQRLGMRRAWIVLGLGATALLCLSIQRNGVFQNRLALWADTAAKRPENPRSRAILGEMLHEVRRLPEAKIQFETALRLKPNYPEAHNNLGTTLVHLGDARGALPHFEAAIRIKPDYAVAHNNLGNVLLNLGEIDRARYHCEEALRIFSDPQRLKPDLPETHNNLGNALLYQGKLAEAQSHYREAVRLKPELLQARMNLGVVLRLQGMFEESYQFLQSVIERKPDFPEAHFNLGVLLHQIGRSAEAIQSFGTAIHYRSEFPEALRNLAEIYRERGDFVRAKTYLEEVVRIRPGDKEARAVLMQLRAGGNALPASPGRMN